MLFKSTRLFIDFPPKVKSDFNRNLVNLFRFAKNILGKWVAKKKYLEIEEILKEIGKQLNLSLAELDLYLWYMETGKILK